MKIEAYYHRPTGFLFKEKQEYKAHLAEYAAQKTFFKKREDRFLNTENLISYIHDLDNLASISETIIENSGNLMEYHTCNSNAYTGTRRHKMVLRRNARKFKIAQLTFLKMKHHFISNTYDAPNGQPTNFSRAKDKPLGFDGWAGEIAMTFTNDDWRFDIPKMLKRLNIHTGAGGSSGNNLRYSVYLFESEWPNMAMMTKMRNGNVYDKNLYEEEEESEY